MDGSNQTTFGDRILGHMEHLYQSKQSWYCSFFSKSGQELNGMVIRPPTEADREPVSCNGQTATWVDCRCLDCR